MQIMRRRVDAPACSGKIVPSRPQVYLWTLAQREGTPCVPTILAMQCNNENACAGLGDRLISLGSAFWLVRRFFPACRMRRLVLLTHLTYSAAVLAAHGASQPAARGMR